jgi:hypothetical protein
MFKISVLFTIAFFNVVQPLSLPNYIKPCKYDDPSFSKCALESGRAAIPYLAKGDKHLKLRVLDPLYIPEIRINTQGTGSIKLVLTENTLYGLGNMELTKVNFDLEAKRLELEFFSKEFKVLGNYAIDGRVLILPITGSGKIDVRLYDGIVKYGFDYDLVQRHGKSYIRPKDPQVSLDSKKSYFNLENLFGGDKRLGEEMNKFLNENDRELTKELNPSIEATIKQIASEIVNTVIGKVPLEELII